MEPEYNQEDSQRNKHLVFIVLTYLLLTVSTHFSAQLSAFNSQSFRFFQDQNIENISVENVFSLFNSENYSGRWNTRDTSPNIALSGEKGKFVISIRKSTKEKQLYEIQMNINNGFYIDQGTMLLKFLINGTKWQVFKNQRSIEVKPRKNVVIGAYYKLDKILRTEEEKILQIKDISFHFQMRQKSKKPVISVKIEDRKSQYISAQMLVEGRSSKLLQSITFAIMLFFVSYLQFSAIMEILKKIIEGDESPSRYSFFTIMITTMWDAVLCIVSFVFAFDNEENLIMYIMPAFLLCLLFTNLELKLMLMIYQANSSGGNLRQVICKFNLISYGGLMLIYPLLAFSNFSILFFISICLIFLPQIYLNGINGIRPQLSSPYYTKYLIARFIIVFYLRSFPWNIFQLEPNYHLSFFCFLLLALQLMILWYQKRYGPKKVIPSFLLPNLFNYKYSANQAAPEQNNECSICLNPLTMQAANQNDLQFQIEHRLMKTPCSHKYHGLCLIKWMKVKMECPQCRNKLPPYE